jgi:hypothetical protein
MLFLAVGAWAQHSSSEATNASALVSSYQSSRVIVVGLLGGFVRWDDMVHPKVGVIRELRQEHPTGAYFAVFENGRLTRPAVQLCER